MKNRIELITIYYTDEPTNNYYTMIYDNIRDVTILYNDAMHPTCITLLDIDDIIFFLCKAVSFEYVNTEYKEIFLNELENRWTCNDLENNLFNELQLY